MREATINGPHIAVIGNCQVSGIGASLRRLRPDSQVDIWHIGVHPDETKEQTRERLRRYDFVFSHLGKDCGDILALSKLRDIVPQVFHLPTVVFRGFQPDCVYLLGPKGVLKGGVGDLHSGIVAAAFMLGIPFERVPRLFNAFVYEALGYFDAFPTAENQLLNSFKAEGYDLKPYFENWLREIGAFMYIGNHPHIRVLADVALLAAIRAGLVTKETPAPQDVLDSLSDSVQWPVYPEIARRLNLAGSLIFRWPAHQATPEWPREASLQKLVVRLYRQYESMPRERLAEYVSTQSVEALRRVLVH
jgi:hypothetical protein